MAGRPDSEHYLRARGGDPTRADAARASMHTAAVNADRTATAADREHAAEAEMAAHESYWHTHGVPAHAAASARQGLIREHGQRGLTQIGAEHQAQAEHGDPEAGE